MRFRRDINSLGTRSGSRTAQAPPTVLQPHLVPKPSKMPKEAKEPLFCCGTSHKSANYHKRTAHQQHTKIYFKGHPEAGFILRRNPVTTLFHCPKCDKSWAMATPIRSHIFKKCAGYAQYRSLSSTKSENEEAENVPPSPSLPRNSHKSPSAACADMDTEHTEGNVPDGSNDVCSPDVDQSSSSSSGGILGAQAQRQKTDTPGPPANPGTTLEQVLWFPPVLRPAIWSPVEAPYVPCAPVGLVPSSSGCSSSLPTLTRSASCSSKSSGHTLANTAPVSRTVAVRFKSDPDDALSVSADNSRYALAQSNPLASSSHSPVQHLPERPTAVRSFLGRLRRPMGDAAPLFYKMGLVTKEDLDLICTLPDAWDEVGVVLQAGGLTTIEWLMVKEAFKTKARELSG
ncbi:uncharacterized protein TRAVEDRAFT_41861 [Trametes versicolor FP-101664 SS1]|uniref:uncharacterized protein n=1 Tax=Trametes versicolor (strain FP-101664) TaxID=717944 RepID=UPI0004623E55|nr:uncharacterized protein TRAVEDRAFT_41861 [Trametes versicolor FP-101664 SS1]EIW64449.1 hypothetical protein TRAVEDRAFT_41861 [Trametes versicolor FP-101664 SS1]